MVFVTGPTNPNWHGGKAVTSQGYIWLKKSDHHFTNANGYVKEHRLVYEDSRNCCLMPWTVVHHKDGNKSNNIWYNLEALFSRAHLRKHGRPRADKSDRLCVMCGTNDASLWRKLQNQWCCRPCWDHFILRSGRVKTRDPITGRFYSHDATPSNTAR